MPKLSTFPPGETFHCPMNQREVSFSNDTVIQASKYHHHHSLRFTYGATNKLFDCDITHSSLLQQIFTNADAVDGDRRGQFLQRYSYSPPPPRSHLQPNYQWALTWCNIRSKQPISFPINLQPKCQAQQYSGLPVIQNCIMYIMFIKNQATSQARTPAPSL